ncbi:MAG: flavin-containing monooxygenase [Solirubrobacteraceae bacterium]
MQNELPEHELAIVGSGFAGLGMAIEAKRAGIEDFVVLERAHQLGGTWRDNHYPGCGCDVPTPLYSYSFAPNPYWSHLYARSEEIRDYLERCADEFAVREKIRFGTEVTGARWDAEAQRWEVEIDGRPALTTRFVVGGFGGLSRPAYPDIDGLEDFAGALFHSAQWDHEVPLAGKRVGVIGTGASAIQLIPQIAKAGAEVTVFQRTPPWIVPKLDRPIRRPEQQLYAKLPVAQKALRALIFTITEGVGVAITRYPRLLAIGEVWARRHMRKAIGDVHLREQLTPDYRLGCKRILPSNDYYPALARDNVELVTAGIDRVTPTGVRAADGADHELDVLVCGTGFQIEEVFMHLDVRGRDGITLRDAWAPGIEAHRGTTISGFPNLALLSGPNTGTGSTSQVYMIEAQIHYALELMRELRRGQAGAIEPRAEAQADYNAWIQKRMQRTVWLRGGCNSWYLDSAGVNRTLYPGPSSSFWRSLRRVELAEYRLEPARRRVSEPVAVPA